MSSADEAAIWAKKIKDKFRNKQVDAQELGEILRGHRPDISEREVQGIFDGCDREKSEKLGVSQLVNFIFGIEPPVILHSPAFADLAAGLRQRLGSKADDVEAVNWETFKSGDSNTRYNWRRIAGRRVVLLFDTVDQNRLLEQLSLIQALQGFPVPDGEDSVHKWKEYMETGAYSWGRAAEISIVIPWYRPCQMERTSRWERKEDGSWTNGDPDGSWLDVPTAQTYIRLVSTPGLPLPGAMPSAALDGRSLSPLWRPPMTVFFIELHEEEPVRVAASDLGVSVRMERFVPYFLGRFRESSTFVGTDLTYVLFPDHGAYGRYSGYVSDVLGLKLDHILWINKKRVAGAITQEPALYFEVEEGEEGEPPPLCRYRSGQGEKRSDRAHRRVGQKQGFTPDEYVLVIDDFTNSGSTLFGAVNMVRSLTPGGDLAASIFVSHTVASYDENIVRGLTKKLEELGPKVRYATTDTRPRASAILQEHPQVDIYPIVDFLSDMLI